MKAVKKVVDSDKIKEKSPKLPKSETKTLKKSETKGLKSPDTKNWPSVRPEQKKSSIPIRLRTQKTPCSSSLKTVMS